MQRYFIYLSYDGFAYHGWQVQPNGATVQASLEKALSTILRQPVAVTGAGRTDTGVHARLMVAHFDMEQALSATEGFVDRLNRVLPKDIAVSRIVPVRNDAHSRFDALSRTYHYYLSFAKDPFYDRYSMRLSRPLDWEAMNGAAACLFRYTDFTSFSKLHTDVKTNNCRIMAAGWEPDGARYRFTIQADRFLRNMVRAIVGTLLDVGRGRLSVEDFCRIIEQKNRCSAGMSVPAQALFLADIAYPDEIFL